MHQMMAFQIPLHFEDLTRPSAAPWRVNLIPFHQTSAEELLSEVETSPSTILSSSAPTSAFSALYSLISHYPTVPKPLRPRLLDFIDTLISAATPTNPSELKIAAYFTSGLCATASAAAPPCKYWENIGRESGLEAAARLLDAVPTPCPFVETHLDQLCALHVRTILCVLEQPHGARDKNARPVLARSLATVLMLHPAQTLPTITALLHALNRHEHLPGPLADLMFRLTEERPQLSHFVGEFVREIGTIPFDDLAHDVAAAKGCALFISELAERLPMVFRSNLAVVLSHLDGDSYAMRNGVVHVLGVLVRAAPNSQDPLLEVLLERAHRDIHAFTRSKALQTWIMLAEAKVIPNRMFPVLADMAASRLDDKTAAVRKYATQLLAALLTNNPFGPVLHKSHFEQKLGELKEITKSDEDPDANLKNGNTPKAGTDEIDDPNSEHSSNRTSIGSGNSASESDEDSKEDNQLNDLGIESADIGIALEEKVAQASDEDQGETEDEKKQKAQKLLQHRFYSSALGFAKSVELGLETAYKLLRSKSVTDVSEAVSLVITAIQFQLEAASGRAVRKMLPLVLARENNIRQAAVSAYVRLLAPGGIMSLDDKECAIAVATGLAALGVGATTGEIACLEALISAMCGKDDACNIMSSSVVAVLWDIFAGRVPGASEEQRRAACILVGMVAVDRPESLQQRVEILETTGLSTPAFARWSCAALCNLPAGSDSDGHLAEKLADLAKTTTDLSTVEQAINAIFALSTEPENVVGGLIRELASDLHDSSSAVEVTDLSRFLQVIGHVAVKELVRIEHLVSQVRRCVANQTRNDGNNEEEEQSAAEADKALLLAEKELVNPSSLLGRYGNLARKIASDKTAPAELQASSVLCMSKLMCVQESFCESNLRLLFSILTSASDPLVRSNAVTALGDLAFRFPNLVEPWSSHIYSALKDKNEKVRKNTLMALTHLILNDMIKVKGQIVGLAICILDDNERIADLARLFFHELARKSNNAIYNILPDTISCMSSMGDLQSDDFKIVVSFLVGLMDKERHADGMIEKLCHRFRTNESERENHDLAYCISQLNISERGIKKMNDSFKSYSNTLCDDVVHGYIMQAVNKGAKHGASGTTSQAVEELTAKIAEVRKSHRNNESSQAELFKQYDRPNGPTHRRKSVRIGNKEPREGESTTDDDTSSTAAESTTQTKRSLRSSKNVPLMRKRGRKVQEPESDEETENIPEEIQEIDNTSDGDETDNDDDSSDSASDASSTDV